MRNISKSYILIILDGNKLLTNEKYVMLFDKISTHFTGDIPFEYGIRYTISYLVFRLPQFKKLTLKLIKKDFSKIN